MSLLTLIQDVVGELGSLPSVTSVISNNDPTVSQLVALLQRLGKDIRDDYVWPQLVKEHSISLVSGQDTYPLKADFNSQIHRTHWDDTNNWELYGPMSPQEWQWIKRGVVSSGPRRRFRIKGWNTSSSWGQGVGSIVIDPVPGSGDTGQILVFEYLSRTWIFPVQWTTATVFNAGAYCSNAGVIYKTTAGGTSGVTAPSGTGTVSDGAISWVSQDNYPYERFISDSDYCLLDEDMLGLGVQYRWLERQGLPFEFLKSQFDMSIAKSVVSLRGAKSLSLVPRRTSLFIGPGNVPDTGYGA